MWVNMNFLGVIYIARNQQAFLEQMTSFVVRYDAIYLSFPIKSQYLMTGGGVTTLFIDLKLRQTKANSPLLFSL